MQFSFSTKRKMAEEKLTIRFLIKWNLFREMRERSVNNLMPALITVGYACD